jgi:hypothetical protein
MDKMLRAPKMQTELSKQGFIDTIVATIDLPNICFWRHFNLIAVGLE